MDDTLRQETEKLARSWMRHEPAMLRDYLVADVEDPRLNVQSILTRHWLTEALTGNRWASLMDHELQFACAMNWLLDLCKQGTTPDEFAAILHGLRRHADNAEGIALPAFATRIFRVLPAAAEGVPIPNYLEQALAALVRTHGAPAIDPQVLSLFQNLWRETLPEAAAERRSVLEAACGSANDYRFLEAFGLARLLDYAGFDLCEKNVANARQLFPQGHFFVGNVFEIAAADRAFEFTWAHDLFEHLSLEGLRRAVAEVCRVTRRGLGLGFFSMHEGDEHIVRPVQDYHWNTLSLPATRALFEEGGFSTECVHLDTLLRWRYAFAGTHNKNAYTLWGRR